MDKGNILRKLAELHIPQRTYDHAPVMTSADLANTSELVGVDGANIKNLFLKDKKNRLYLISKLESTPCDLKVLARRLGLPKDSLRLAPAELMLAVLGVPLGSATPLAVANPTAAGVILILDQRFQQQQQLWLHPMTNTATTVITPAGLEAFLRGIGREPVYVDLEADPVVDAEHPADLKSLTEAAPSCVESSSGSSHARSASTAPATEQNGVTAVLAKQSSAAMPLRLPKQSGPQAMDVNAITESILSKVSAAYGAAIDGKGLGDDVARRLAADIEMQLNALRNAAYAKGVTATRAQIAHFAKAPYRCLST